MLYVVYFVMKLVERSKKEPGNTQFCNNIIQYYSWWFNYPAKPFKNQSDHVQECSETGQIG